jgi:hypothetical protein
MRRRRGDRDEGIVTAFVVVFAVVLIFITGLVLDGGRILVEYRQARSVADSAARAGAQAINEDGVRTGSPVLLDAGRAEQRACAIVRLDGYSCGGDVQVATNDDSVTVTLTTTVDMWLLDSVGPQTITVEGNACVAVGITDVTRGCDP